MSKQASKSTNTVSFKAPRAGGMCWCAWVHFATTPTTSKDLPALAEREGYNLTNLRIELSRYNRYIAAGNKFTV